MSESKNVVVAAVELPSCSICAEYYTTVVRKKVECNSCHKEVCSKCIEKYMMSNLEDPHCLHCRSGWNRAFLTTFLTAAFLNKTYYAYRQTVLLNREKSFLPQYQVAAEREVKIRSLEREDAAVKERYNLIERKRNEELYAISKERTLLWRKIDNVRMGREETASAGTTVRTVVATKFIRRCPATGCNGFLSSAWKCGICNHWACPDCFEVKGLERDVAHTCTADALATAALIRKDTKPCPSCGEMISKIDGCDQMFCTSCHKPFSWISGQAITKGAIHNPHYYQWIAKGGAGAPANRGFVPCGGFPNPYHLQSAIHTSSTENRKKLLSLLRQCIHMNEVERHRYERHLDPINNEELGVQFLLKTKSEDDWKAALGRREKDRQKCNEIRDILDAFDGAAIDLFRRFDTTVQYPRKECETLVLSVIEELEALRKFIFQSMTEVSRSFNCSVPLLNEKWELEHGNIRDMNRRLAKAEAEKVAKEAKEAAEGPTGISETTETTEITVTAAPE